MPMTGWPNDGAIAGWEQLWRRDLDDIGTQFNSVVAADDFKRPARAKDHSDWTW